jgi:CBS domain-containing protein
MDIFKKIGPRYVIVEKGGKLEGLITKKDILRALYGQDVHQNIPERDYQSLDRFLQETH